MQHIELLVEIPSKQEKGHVHRIGARGVLVEHLGARASLVEIRVADESLEGDAWYETIEVRNSEFKLVE